MTHPDGSPQSQRARCPACFEGLGPTLVAVPDDADGLAGQVPQVGILLEVHAGHQMLLPSGSTTSILDPNNPESAVGHDQVARIGTVAERDSQTGLQALNRLYGGPATGPPAEGEELPKNMESNRGS